MKLSSESLQFLESVWEKHLSGWVFISVKKGEDWRDIPIDLSQAWMGKLTSLEFEDGSDLYFCPNAFKGPRRLEPDAHPTVWLHADLDEVLPTGVKVMPTIAWQTSRGRYQGLWELEKRVTPKIHRAVNKRLTYDMEADLGGWSMNKALRIPGTLSYKRDGVPQRVTLMWDDMPPHPWRRVLAEVKDALKKRDGDVDGDVELSDKPARELVIEHRKAMGKKALKLLLTKKAEVGTRSSKLWELECLLMEARVPKDEALVMVRACAWNKYKGQRREVRQLWTELCKAEAQVGVGVGNGNGVGLSGEGGGVSPTLMSYSTFMKKEIPAKQWAVEGVWSHGAHGFLAGEPKTYKSFVATDLAVSVASGTPFLGQFPVPEKGHTIIIQEENTLSMMRDRLEKISMSRGLGGEVIGTKVKMPERLDISLVNCSGMDLTSDEHIELLDSWMEEKKPKLVVLDPLYLMISGLNESSQEAMVPVFKSLLELKRKHGCGMLIVHHYNKPREGDDRSSMMRLSGSGVLGRWFESIIYLDKMKAPGKVKMTTEHRSHAPTKPLHLEFDIAPMGTPEYYVTIEEGAAAEEGTSRDQVIKVLRAAGEEGMTAAEVAEQLGFSTRHGANLMERMKLESRTVKVEGVAGRPPKRYFV